MITIYGSHGELDADEVTGAVLARRPDGGYADILSFDVAEWRRAYPAETLGDVDILDVGYWLKNGNYEGPDPHFRKSWRAEVAAGAA